jgi:hypothetical protein
MDEPMTTTNPNQFNKWHGIDRNSIDWYPVIDESDLHPVSWIDRELIACCRSNCSGLR